jgi:Family of unknown function (DUF5719)
MQPRYRRPLFAILVVAVLGGIYAVAGAGHPAAAVRSAGTSGRQVSLPVEAAERVCPAPGSTGVTASSVALAAVPGSASEGKAVITRLVPAGSSGPGPVLATVTKPGLTQFASVATAAPLPKKLAAGQPGSSSAVTTQSGRGGVMVSATGAMAQGLDVEQEAPGGLATAECEPPGTSFWFVGPGQTAASNIELYLMNTGSQAADAAVSVLTGLTKGAPVLANADNGITVPPHSMVVQSLAKLLKSSKMMALNITTSVGQVVAAVRESSSSADDGLWLPQTQPPSRSLVIPGLPGSSGSRQLYIAVPGTAAAQVKITAVTTKGSYLPTGGSGIEMLGGSITAISLSSLSGVPGAIRISANVPVTAGVLLPGGPAGTPGVLAVAAAPVVEQGVLADNPAHSAGSAQIVLSAPAKAATVRIIEATTNASVSGQSGTIVHVPARSAVVVPVAPPKGSKASAFTVVITPEAGSGAVYAARLASAGGVLRSVLPVASSPTTVQLPAVRDSLLNIVG